MALNNFTLPGERVTATSRRDWLRSMVSGAYLLGPAHRRLMRSTVAGTRDEVHEAEKRWARTAAIALGLKLETSGLHHVDPGHSYVVLPLHEGFADLLAIQAIPLSMVYVAAEELFEWEHLGPYLRASDQPGVSRTNGPQAYRTLLRAGAAAKANLESLVVFPQGTILGLETAFEGGAFRAAQRLGIPILPVVLTGASSVWDYPFDTSLHFGRTVRLEVLESVPPHLAVAQASDLEGKMKELALKATPPPRRYVPERDGWWDDYRFEIDSRFPELKEQVEQHRDSITAMPADRSS